MKKIKFVTFILVILFLSGCISSAINNQNKMIKSAPKEYSKNHDVNNLKGEVKPSDKITIEPKIMIPNRMVIPAIHLNAMIEPVGLHKNGQMDVPNAFDRAGILSPWTKPGEKGNAVIAGHLDHYTGPAIFYHLKKLKPGDEIFVFNPENTKLTFAVKSVESFRTKDAPIERIFGKAQTANLNLITCAGKFNKKTKEHALRLVVFTQLLNENHFDSSNLQNLK